MFATRAIKRADYIATYRGPIITSEECDRRERLGAKYMFEINSRWVIDGSPRWNVARYINHSCWPNAKPVSRKRRIVIVATRLIAPGEEITYHYGPQYFDYFKERWRLPLARKCRTKAAVRRSKRAAARKKNGHAKSS